MFKRVKKTDNFLDSFGKLISIDSRKCVRFISKHKVVCDICTKQCPSQAISIDKMGITINWESCLECGICAKECRTGVFSLKYYLDSKIYNEIATFSKSNGFLVVSCKKVSSKNRSGVTIPCGGWVDDSTFIWAVSQGAKNIYIKLSDCENCTIKCGYKTLSTEIEKFYLIQKELNIECNIKLIDEGSEIKADFKQTDNKDDVNLSRRELFSYFKNRSKKSIGQIYNYMSDDNQKAYSRNFVLSKDKKLPFRKNVFISALNFLSSEKAATYDFKTKYLGGVQIDLNECNLCGICYRLCPTGALKEISKESDEGYLQKAGVEANNIYCINCDICISWCDKKAINYMMDKRE